MAQPITRIGLPHEVKKIKMQRLRDVVLVSSLDVFSLMAAMLMILVCMSVRLSILAITFQATSHKYNACEMCLI